MLNRLTAVILLCTGFALAACEPGNAPPTLPPGGTPATIPTQLPAATVGPLVQADLSALGLTLLTPSTWKPPAVLNGNILIVSPTGSTDTSAVADPFLMIGDAQKVASSKLNFAFRPDISDPLQQLDLLMAAINLDAPSFTAAAAYYGARYPGAITYGFARDNEMNVILLNLGNNRWLYVGTQAPERYFAYYNDAVFKPAINSITLKTS